MLTRDGFRVLVTFLPLKDLKSISLANKQLLNIVRREFLSRDIVVKCNECTHQFFLQLKMFSHIIPFKVHFEELHELYWLILNDFDLYNIRLGDCVNLHIMMLPENLRILKFGERYNCPIDKLPPNLETLVFGHDFNQPIGMLPQNLRKLKFGWDFNQPLGMLPRNLQTLKLGYHFNQPLGVLPTSLLNINFGEFFDQPISLPPNLQKLALCWRLFRHLNDIRKNYPKLDITLY